MAAQEIAASSLQFKPTHGSPEERCSAGSGEAATATVYKGEDTVAPQGIAATATSSLEFEYTSDALEECSSGSPDKAMTATISEGDDADSSYVLVDHAESDGTSEGDMHVIGEMLVPVEGEVGCEVNDNCLQNFGVVSEDLDGNCSPSPPVEDVETEMCKAFENDILLLVIGAAEVENKSCPVPTRGGHLLSDDMHIEQDENDLISSSSFEVTDVADGNNDFADSLAETTSRGEAEVVPIQDVEDVLPCDKSNKLTLIKVETFPCDDEKTTPRNVKSSLRNDEISKSPPSDFLHKLDDSCDVGVSFGINVFIPPVDRNGELNCDGNGEHKCDDNVEMLRPTSLGLVMNVEVDSECQNKLATCEILMDHSDHGQPEDGNGTDVKLNDNEIDLKEVVVDNVASSLVDDSDYLVNPKFYMVRVPRILDNKLSEQVDVAQRQLEEMTHQRDSIRKELQNKKAICNEYGKDFNDAKAEEKAAQLAFSMKRKEIEKLRSMIVDINVRVLTDDVVAELQHLEHKIQHETMPLKEEKLLLRKIKELKQNHASLSLKLGTNSELHKSVEEKTQIEGKLKHLSFELKTLRDKLFQAKTRTDTSRKRCDEGYNILRELQAQHKIADDLRQHAYMNMRSLKKELSLKNRHFYKYKDDVSVAASYASTRNLKALREHCIQQMEMIMGLWNENDEFRRSYVQSNQFSTVRRFKTLDGRSLGLDEEPASLPTIRRNPMTNSMVSHKLKTMPHDETTQENVGKTSIPSDVDYSSMNMVQKKVSNESKEKSILKLEVTSASVVVEQNEDRVAKPDEEIVPTLTSVEMAKEELMKLQAVEELKAKIIAEQKAKRKEAEERKRRKAEKAKILADTKARREAELRDKKRAKKKTQNITSCENNTTSAASSVVFACATEVIEAPQDQQITSEKPSTFSYASRSHYKVKTLPPHLRHKGKRKSYLLTWVLLSAVLVILFLVGYHFSLYRI